MEHRAPALLLLIASLAFAAAPFLVPSFSGYDPAAFPHPIDEVPLQPVGWAFAIWGVIYAWLVVHAGYGAVHRPEDPAWALPRVPLGFALVLGAFWLPAAQTAPLAATAMIWAMAALATLALCRTRAAPDGWLLRAPIALFAGWLTAATAVASATVLTGFGLLPPLGAALLMLVAALVAALLVLRRTGSAVYAGGVLWALAGVVVENLDQNLPMLVATLLGGALLADRTQRRVTPG
ncbi:hypothetical protein [Frigidibacter oleivorans]|uniref:hypothetical protein n=1 Tax=Frigidibacter oleivorans TaxID=2487129 RepID=UPI000F8E537B|nr:hypothetical protein [Frigidibacter oleivorans]